MENDHARDMLDQLGVPFPPHALKSRSGGGGKQLTYVETETVIRRLNAVVGAWDFKLTSHEWAGDILIAFGELTIPGLGTRAGTGVQRCADLTKTEDLVKGAASDCLKKCATLFNVGIDLYGPDLEAGEIAQDAPYAPPMAQRSQTATNAPQRAPQAQNGASGNEATDKQHAFLRKLADDKGLTGNGLHAYAKRESMKGISKFDMSALLDRLKEVSAEEVDAANSVVPAAMRASVPAPFQHDGGIDNWNDFWKVARPHGISNRVALQEFIGMDVPNDPAAALAILNDTLAQGAPV